MNQFDDNILTFVIGGITLFMSFALLLIYILVRYSTKQYQNFLEKQKLISDVNAAKVKEGERLMKQISREVHDNIGQCAHMVRGNLHVIKRKATDFTQLDRIDDTIELVDRLIDDAKHIAYSLNSEYLKANGLQEGLSQLISQAERSSGISFSFQANTEEYKLLTEEKLLVLRIAQEAIHNITKHSRATRASVLLDYQPGNFRMEVKDNGIGIPREEMTAYRGLGLNNMRERAALLNGQIIVDSDQKTGCTLTLWIENIKYRKV